MKSMCTSREETFGPAIPIMRYQSFDEFRATKHVHWDFSTDPKPFWYP